MLLQGDFAAHYKHLFKIRRVKNKHTAFFYFDSNKYNSFTLKKLYKQYKNKCICIAKRMQL